MLQIFEESSSVKKNLGHHPNAIFRDYSNETQQQGK